MSNKALKPCPFCGGDAYVANNFDQYYIGCNHDKKCIAAPDTWLRHSNLSIERQIKLWNRRK